jgi:hypothetical protein
MDPYFRVWFCFDSEYTLVKYNLTMHTRTLVIYGFYLNLTFFKTNIHYDLVFNINKYIHIVCHKINLVLKAFLNLK